MTALRMPTAGKVSGPLIKYSATITTPAPLASTAFFPSRP